MDDIHYLHFGILLWGITGVVCILVSLITKPIPEENLYRLTYWSRRSEKVRIDLDDGDEIMPESEASSRRSSLGGSYITMNLCQRILAFCIESRRH